MKDIQTEQNGKEINTLFRGAVAFCATLYFFSSATSRSMGGFFDSLNLTFHEAGHTLAFLFPEPVMVVSGSVFQIAVPLILAIYFFIRGAKYSGSLLLFWVGQSVVSVSLYAADAVSMKLPLLGGENSIHDWNYLLSLFDVLPHTKLIAIGIYSFGIIVLIGASALSFFYVRAPRRRDLVVYAGVVISHEGKVLFVEENFEEADGLWSLPVTPLLKKEEIEDAARRIVAEQAGYNVGLFGVPTVVLTSGINMRTVKDHALCPIRLYLFDAAIIGECTPRGGAVKSVGWIFPKDVDSLSLRAEWMRLFARSATQYEGAGVLQKSAAI